MERTLMEAIAMLKLNEADIDDESGGSTVAEFPHSKAVGV
jgi:hypothetical protein